MPRIILKSKLKGGYSILEIKLYKYTTEKKKPSTGVLRANKTRGGKMMTTTTTALLGEKASTELVKGVIELARELAQEEITRQNMKPLRQKELMALYRFDHKYIKYLKAHGLKSRKQGKSVYYDIRDVDMLLDKLKE